MIEIILIDVYVDVWNMFEILNKQRMLMQWYKMLNRRNEQLSLPFDLDLMTLEKTKKFY
jgi:hypothetical protein